MDDAALKKAFRNAWILVILAAVFIVAAFLFVLRTNENPPPPKWNMGGVPFVPASSGYAEDYYSPVDGTEKESDK